MYHPPTTKRRSVDPEIQTACCNARRQRQGPVSQPPLCSYGATPNTLSRAQAGSIHGRDEAKKKKKKEQKRGVNLRGQQSLRVSIGIFESVRSWKGKVPTQIPLSTATGTVARLGRTNKRGKVACAWLITVSLKSESQSSTEDRPALKRRSLADTMWCGRLRELVTGVEFDLSLARLVPA